MAEPEKKEGIFKKAVDAFSSKDEKETIAELEAELEQAKKDSASKWGGKIPTNLKTPLRDGDPLVVWN